MKNDTQATVDQLNSFLRGEISAVETYRQALEKLEQFPQRATLEQCAASHRTRVDLLTSEVTRRGGTPAEGSGAWGAFAKAVEGTATVFGTKAAIAALEEGEDHGRDDYKRGMDGLDNAARELLQTRIMPEQLRTHDALSMLKKTLS
ncbi:MAG TPA: DUF2383 domain-containing protein [Polyangiales bacterium]